jgi:hypothetical protein
MNWPFLVLLYSRASKYAPPSIEDIDGQYYVLHSFAPEFHRGDDHANHKTVLFILLLQPILGGALLGARQYTQAHKGPRNSDKYMKREVRHELTMVPWYSEFDILQFSVHGNEVTLIGAVVNPTLKTDAVNAVKRIEGVEKVNDQIEVLPPSPMDDQIRRAEYRAIYSQGTLSRYG